MPTWIFFVLESEYFKKVPRRHQQQENRNHVCHISNSRQQGIAVQVPLARTFWRPPRKRQWTWGLRIKWNMSMLRKLGWNRLWQQVHWILGFRVLCLDFRLQVSYIIGSTAGIATVGEFVFADSANAGKTSMGGNVKTTSAGKGMFSAWILSMHISVGIYWMPTLTWHLYIVVAR